MVVLTRAIESVAGYFPSSQVWTISLTEELVAKVIDVLLQVRPPHRADLHAITMGKPVHLMSPVLFSQCRWCSAYLGSTPRRAIFPLLERKIRLTVRGKRNEAIVATSHVEEKLGDDLRNRVVVNITRPLAVPPAEARAAWLEYAWIRGGGLPLVLSLASANGQERLLLPLLFKERLVTNATEDKLGYVLDDAGALSADLIAGSHAANIQFAPSTPVGGTVLTWNVQFRTNARNALWKAVTQSTVGEVLANLQAFTASPSVFILTARLKAPPPICVDRWLDCFADGIPLPTVVLDSGEGGVGCERLLLPPGLRERILEIERLG